MSTHLTRRSILKSAAASAAFLAMGTNFAHALGSDRIRVGLIGAGGRGRGAARDCTKAADGVEITAVGEIFDDRLAEAKKVLAESLKGKFKAKDDNCFVGFDAYQKVIASDVDMVILTTPPCFRPEHIRAAAEAGKHIFAEKPVAVDSTGARSVLGSAELIDEKKLNFVCGTQRRHMPGYQDVIKRIHDGAIGDVVGGSCYWLQNGIWMKPRQSEWSDLEWQLRNWPYFTAFSGDHIVEQHIHNIDVMNWALGGPPEKAYGVGGRQSRTDQAYGHIFDHFAVEFTYKNDVRVTSMCRQIDGTDARIGEEIVGTKGSANPRKGTIKTGSDKYRFPGGEEKMSVGQIGEHRALIDAIRSGNRINEAKRIAETTLTAIMGRMSAYTGKEVTFEQALNSKEDLVPKKLDFKESYAIPSVATPGKTPLV